MYAQESCPCCGKTSFREFLGIVSPFIAAYVLGERPRPTVLLECVNCNFRFFKERFTAEEASCLYADYRQERYFQERHRFEFWYSRKINESIGGDPSEIATRKRLAESLIREHAEAGRIFRVLDYGGDRGQFIPDSIGREKFVYDISGVRTESGVTSIHDGEGLKQFGFDLIMLCHVLEHMSNPSELLIELRKLAKAEGTYYFVEVPYERYSLTFARRTKTYKTYLKAVTRLPRPLLALLDLYSTASRFRLDTVPPLGFAKLHEHINFFDADSLSALLQRCGFRVLGARVAHEAKTAVGFQGTVLCLAVANSEQSP